MEEKEVCPECVGNGYIVPDENDYAETCLRCHGTGKVSKSEPDEIREAFLKSDVFDFDSIYNHNGDYRYQFVEWLESRYKSASSRIAELEEEVERMRTGIHKAYKYIGIIDDDATDILYDLIPDQWQPK